MRPMRMMMLATVVTGLLTSCSSSDGAADTQPAQCDKTKRTGTYLLHYEVASGDCPAPADGLVDLTTGNSTTGGPSNCNVDSVRWSEGDCRSDITLTCAFSDGTTRTVGYTRQKTADGSRIEGTLSVTVTLRDGQSCSGTENVTYVRQ